MTKVEPQLFAYQRCKDLYFGGPALSFFQARVKKIAEQCADEKLGHFLQGREMLQRLD